MLAFFREIITICLAVSLAQGNHLHTENADLARSLGISGFLGVNNFRRLFFHTIAILLSGEQTLLA